MPATTGNEIVAFAYRELNVYLIGRPVPAPQANVGLEVLNDMLSEWRNQRLMVPTIARERFDSITDKGGPYNPYTIGPGGDFDTERPANQNAIMAANLILTSTDPEVRVSLAINTDFGYFANPLPDMGNAQPTTLYYNPTYVNDLGSIFLWPVPTVNYNQIELLLQKAIARFANLTTTYYVPEGAISAIKYSMMERLASMNGRTLTATQDRMLRRAMGAWTRSNVRLTDMANDYAFTSWGQKYFNINTGQ